MRLRKSSMLTRLIVLALAVYAIVTLLGLQTQISQQEEANTALSEQISATAQENQRLQQAIERVGSREGVEEVARNKLGLVTEGEIIFYNLGE